MSNYSVVETLAQEPEFILAPWIVKQPTKIVVIPVDSTPQYNKAAQVEESHMLLKANHRDLDGKHAPQDKPVTRKQAMRNLNVSSQRLDSAIDRMMEIESW